MEFTNLHYTQGDRMKYAIIEKKSKKIAWKGNLPDEVKIGEANMENVIEKHKEDFPIQDFEYVEISDEIFKKSDIGDFLEDGKLKENAGKTIQKQEYRLADSVSFKGKNITKGRKMMLFDSELSSEEESELEDKLGMEIISSEEVDRVSEEQKKFRKKIDRILRSEEERKHIKKSEVS